VTCGRGFSPGTLVSSTNKTDCHDITEILLKVAKNTINLNGKTITYIDFCDSVNSFGKKKKNFTVIVGNSTIKYVKYVVTTLKRSSSKYPNCWAIYWFIIYLAEIMTSLLPVATHMQKLSY
jgi:hypothetical protein